MQDDSEDQIVQIKHTIAALIISAVAAAFSGIYFLFLPTGGYQGGRNPPTAVPQHRG
jgi:hypothetical protein